MLIVYILEILRLHSNEDNRMSQKEIEERLRKDYSMPVDRKAVKRNLLNLYEHDARIDCKMAVRRTKNGEETTVCTDWYMSGDFTDMELRYLIDAVLSSVYIPYHQSNEIIEKLSGLASTHFHAKVKHLHSLSGNRPKSDNLFDVIDVLDKAIGDGKKVMFYITGYGTDKKRHEAKEKDGTPKLHKASPYHMVNSNGRYYLVCNCEPDGVLSNYRIDRITGIEMLDENARPLKEVLGGGSKLDVAGYMNEHINLRAGKSAPISVVFQANKGDIIGEILDRFGMDVTFFEETDCTVKVRARMNKKDMLCWALQNYDEVVVLSPKELREDLSLAVMGLRDTYLEQAMASKIIDSKMGKKNDMRKLLEYIVRDEASGSIADVDGIVGELEGLTGLKGLRGLDLDDSACIKALWAEVNAKIVPMFFAEDGRCRHIEDVQDGLRALYSFATYDFKDESPDEACRLEANSVKKFILYRESGDWFDCDGCDLSKQVYKALWGCEQAMRGRLYVPSQSIFRDLHWAELGADTMNSCALVLANALQYDDELKNYTRGERGASLRKDPQGLLDYLDSDGSKGRIEGISKHIHDFANLTHSLGNFTLIPYYYEKKPFNVYRARSVMDFWDMSLKLMEDAYGKEALGEYVDAFYHFDYIDGFSQELPFEKYRIASLCGCHEDCLCGNEAVLPRDRRSLIPGAGELDEYLRGVNRRIVSRGTLMAVVLLLKKLGRVCGA
ncbi:MAG: WYL domain-containing protein [Clostridiales bacterium]|nr:WYL domain-containing protein [Clostridiales bacterium]